jgi:O-antigen/teichoic acid export membrane protein
VHLRVSPTQGQGQGQDQDQDQHEDTGCATVLSGTLLPELVPSFPAKERRRLAKSAFARHVLVFSSANLVLLACNGVLTFLLPRLLSFESYGYYRLFILYGGFAGMLHFGLLDGALVRWAARSRRRMPAEMRHSLIFLLFQHAMLLIPAMTILVVWFRHQPWFFLALAILFYALVWNAALLGQFALQADKSFGLLSLVTVLNPALLLGMVVAMNHWGRLTLKGLLEAYLGAWLAAGIALWIILLARYPRKKYSRKIRSIEHVWQTGAYNIRAGWSILLAGFLTNLALSLDRFAVSLSFSIRDFAIYSLAATALAVVNTIILSVSRVAFPYLCDGFDADLRIRVYAWGEATLMGLWALSLAGYFPLRLLIERMLPAYQPSLPILRLLMLATGLTAVIYILHANYFRSSLRLGSLLLGASVGLGAAGSFLALARRSHSLVNMSWAMVGAILLWWTADEFLLRRQILRAPRDIARTLIFTSACGGSFLLCAAISTRWLGALAYGGVAILLTGAVYWRTLQSLPLWSRQSMVLRWSGGPE